MLIETVDFTNNLAKIHLRQFLSSEPAILQLEECRKAIVECVSVIILINQAIECYACMLTYMYYHRYVMVPLVVSRK